MHLIRFNHGLRQQHNTKRPLQGNRPTKAFLRQRCQAVALPFPGNQARPDPDRRKRDAEKQKREKAAA
jgi:hypothetical protein